MAEGKLYCEHCGEDIHIVPDFEPELERSLELTMNGILEDLDEDISGQTDGMFTFVRLTMLSGRMW